MKNIADIKIPCLMSVTFQKYTVTKFITEDIKNYVVKKREVQNRLQETSIDDNLDTSLIDKLWGTFLWIVTNNYFNFYY